MGAVGPKRLDGGVDPHQELLDKMEGAVKDAILSGGTEDYFLAVLIDLTVASIRENRPLFPNLMDEPILYRAFRRFVQEGLDALERAKAIEEA